MWDSMARARSALPFIGSPGKHLPTIAATSNDAARPRKRRGGRRLACHCCGRRKRATTAARNLLAAIHLAAAVIWPPEVDRARPHLPARPCRERPWSNRGPVPARGCCRKQKQPRDNRRNVRAAARGRHAYIAATDGARDRDRCIAAVRDQPGPQWFGPIHHRRAPTCLGEEWSLSMTPIEALWGDRLASTTVNHRKPADRPSPTGRRQ